MKIKEIKHAPYVDEVELVFEPNNERRVRESEKIRELERKKCEMKIQALRKKLEEEKKRAWKMEKERYAYAKMLERSLRTPIDPNYKKAIKEGYKPFHPTDLIRDPLKGWVKGEIAQQKVSLKDPDFNIHRAVPAQEFTNHIRARDLAYRDYPLVRDTRNTSDFSGVIVDEASSPDFSNFAVVKDKTDFGGITNLERLKRIKGRK